MNNGFRVARIGSFYCWRLGLRPRGSPLINPVAVVSMPFCAFVKLWRKLVRCCNVEDEAYGGKSQVTRRRAFA